MKRTKIDFFSVDKWGGHRYEFSSNIQLNTTKPLTKIVIATSNKMEVPISLIKSHKRNNIEYAKPLNLKNSLGLSVFNQEDVVRFYCKRAN